ncbi:hypothetical protein [Novacetimonas pomaceti]|uniref:hypothetical protein n=1 Tax=Novacetimonas pomaceti TaxID=2021998 RepID=UPI001057F72D|nr:hypothetical protein [Novacetimonas pomaceti]MBV1832557.1 hypothetical protein [Novacetimonas pomaceti]
MSRTGRGKWGRVLACLMFQVGMLLLVAMPSHAMPIMPHSPAMDAVTAMAPMNMAGMPDLHAHASRCHHDSPCGGGAASHHGDEHCCLQGANCVVSWAVAPSFPILSARYAMTMVFGITDIAGGGGTTFAPALPPPRKTA